MDVTGSIWWLRGPSPTLFRANRLAWLLHGTDLREGVTIAYSCTLNNNSRHVNN